MSTRRNLRNSSTCPNIPNPFRARPHDTNTPAPLPPHLSHLVAQFSNLSCSQITSLPPLDQPPCPEEAIQLMRNATQLQARQVNDLKTAEQQVQRVMVEEVSREAEAVGVREGEGMGCMKEEAVKEEGCWEGQCFGVPLLRSDVFDSDLRDFLMQPPNPILDCEYPFNAHSFIHFQNHDSNLDLEL